MDSCPSSPRSTSSPSPWGTTTTAMPFDWAASRVRSMASCSTRDTGTGSIRGGASPLCKRERSMSSWTSRDSRRASTVIRSAKRRTEAGSSLDSLMASASRLKAPTGVLSSWLTLATKSRRTASTRCASVTSSRTMTISPSGKLMTRTRADGPALSRRGSRSGGSARAGRVTSRSRVCPSARTARTRALSTVASRRPPRTTPSPRAAWLAITTRSRSSSTTTPEGSRATICSAMPTESRRRPEGSGDRVGTPEW